MSRTTTVAGLVVAGLLAAAVPAVLPAGATPAEPTRLVAPLRAVVPADDEAFIEGAVLDRAGRYVDGVTVEAIDKRGEVAASSISYENPDEDQDHGFYRLYVAPGTYRIRFSSEKDVDKPFRTQLLPGSVRVRARAVRLLEDVVVTLRKPAASRVTAAPVAKSVRRGRPVQVRVRVTSPDVAPVLGKVEVSVDGRRSVTAKLVRRSGGKLVVTLAKRPRPGRHTVAVRFVGSSLVKASKAKPVTVVVARG